MHRDYPHRAFIPHSIAAARDQPNTQTRRIGFNQNMEAPELESATPTDAARHLRRDPAVTGHDRALALDAAGTPVPGAARGCRLPCAVRL